METQVLSLSPKQTFADNMRPAVLLLQVFSLLECSDVILSEGDLLEALRTVIQAPDGEDLLLIYNELFLGLVRERAQLPRSTLRQATLCHLLRQAIVASCTALETYLPALLKDSLPVMIRALGRDFVPSGDDTVQKYFADLQFGLDETLRLLGDENAPEYISTKIISRTDYAYLSSRKGVHVVGRLLGLTRPWADIAEHLSRDKKELMNVLDDTVRRRNDIVHRADRPQDDPGGVAQTITYSWTKQGVDTIDHICHALNELVAARVSEIKAMTEE